MGIRKSVLDERLDLHTWASWKEQLSFGGVKDSYTVTPTLPQAVTRTKAPINDFLYFAVVHEFGHMFDFANQLNRTEECPPSPSGETKEECPMAKESWGILSWKTESTPQPENQFPYRKGLCFYWCGLEPMTGAAVRDVYRGLALSNFLSTYAATNPWDDFADSLAYYVMREALGTPYVLDTRQGETYDIMGKVVASVFATKRQYIAAFLAREDIVYP